MRVLIVVLACAGVLACSACSSSTEPGRSLSFLIRVDRLDAPAEVGPDEPIVLTMDGTIGPDLCHVFDRIVASRSRNTVTLQLWGRHTGGGACALAISELRGATYILSPPHTGTVRVIVMQPDGGTLERVIAIR